MLYLVVIISLLILFLSGFVFVQESFTPSFSSSTMQTSPLTQTSSSMQTTTIMDASGNVIPIGSKLIPSSGIPDGYYQSGTTQNGTPYISPIPYGYTTNTDKTVIQPTIQASIINNPNNGNAPTNLFVTNSTNSPSNPVTQYNSDNFNLSYHADELVPGNNFYDVSVNIPPATYYQPGTYHPNEGGGFVPSYTDSVFLNPAIMPTGEQYTSAQDFMGFCEKYRDQPIELEKRCQAMDKNTCASTSCCVLLGGQKCVHGDEYGPTAKANYSDIFVTNRDYYYYKGMCYGVCPK